MPYVREKIYSDYHQRRWVEYNDYFSVRSPNGDRVPPKWHGWLSHQYDDIPAPDSDNFHDPFFERNHDWSPSLSKFKMYTPRHSIIHNRNIDFHKYRVGRYAKEWEPKTKREWWILYENNGERHLKFPSNIYLILLNLYSLKKNLWCKSIRDVPMKESPNPSSPKNKTKKLNSILIELTLSASSQPKIPTNSKTRKLIFKAPWNPTPKSNSQWRSKMKHHLTTKTKITPTSTSTRSYSIINSLLWSTTRTNSTPILLETKTNKKAIRPHQKAKKILMMALIMTLLLLVCGSLPKKQITLLTLSLLATHLNNDLRNPISISQMFKDNQREIVAQLALRKVHCILYLWRTLRRMEGQR